MARNTLASAISYARNTGRLIVETWGDSTGERNGKGHMYGAAGAIMRVTQGAGLFVPANATSGNNLTIGLYEARRHRNSAIIGGVSFPDNLVTNGYAAALKQHGFGVPLVGIRPQTATTLNDAGGISNSDTTITVTSGATLEAAPGWVRITSANGKELIYYGGKAGNNLTSCIRGQFCTAVAHADGSVVEQATLWSGPAPAVLGETQLNGAIASGTAMAGAGVITVDDTSRFCVPSSGNTPKFLFMHDGVNREIFQYTGVTATTFTGVTRSPASYGTSAQNWADNTPIYACLNGSDFGGLLFNEHPLGVSGQLKAAWFWKSTSASSVNGATVYGNITSQSSPVNTDGTRTVVIDGSAVNMTGTAVGTPNRTVVTGAQADRTSLSLMFSSKDSSNGLGPFGPAALQYVGVFGGARPKGVIQGPGISLGSQTLGKLHYDLNKYDTGSTVNEFNLGLIEKYKMYLETGDSDLGGNGSVALLHICAFGHNEVGTGGGYGGLPNSDYPWTILVETVAAGNGAADTSLTITDIAGLPSSAFVIRIMETGEYIFVTSQIGGVLTGCVRGCFGSIPQVIDGGHTVQVGYLTCNPKGFASEVLFDYLWHKAAWIAAGGTEATYQYAYARPIPVSASPTYGDLDTGASGSLEAREGRLRQFTTEIEQRLGSLPGFIVVDFTDDIAGAETTDNHNGSASGDVIHNEGSFYEQAWARMVGYNVYGAGAGNDAIGGVRRGGLRGRGR